jgi:hypothetical protein
VGIRITALSRINLSECDVPPCCCHVCRNASDKKQAPSAKLIPCLVGTDKSFHLFLRGRNVVEMSPPSLLPSIPHPLPLCFSVSTSISLSLSTSPSNLSCPGPCPPTHPIISATTSPGFTRPCNVCHISELGCAHCALSAHLCTHFGLGAHF